MRNLQGQRFSRLLVLRQSEIRTSSKGLQWVCRCDCGRETTASSTNLLQGNTKSCGCLRVEAVIKTGHASKKHGNRAVSVSGTGERVPQSPAYISWLSMKLRCLNPTHISYARYGGRGITICGRWLGEHGFENFLADMGPRPAGKTIDRENSNGNYEPSNCRWATAAEQAKNRASAWPRLKDRVKAA